ncbi:MAG: ATP-binding cassette domain-containing protein [Ruminococcus sp.]|nr:ATP-binding cassette domain-containing protein [Ruminococcus sp.]
MEHIIEVKDLKKSYGEVRAVKGIDFYVEKGQMFAFLGPNGAGKSTTIDMLCTFLKPDSGEAVLDGKVLGKDDDGIRDFIGAVFQDGLLDKLLTVEENLKIRGSLYGLKGSELKEAIDKASEATGISNILKRPYGKLSGGQRRRCDIARALINSPKVLFLDEPTTGLDPQTRKSVWETIIALQKKLNMTVFLTTHYMEEAANADYVIIIDDGMISAQGTPLQLKEKYTSNKAIIECNDVEKAIKALDDSNTEYEQQGNTLIVRFNHSKDMIELLNLLKDNVKNFEVLSGTMDDVFIAVTGKEIRE